MMQHKYLSATVSNGWVLHAVCFTQFCSISIFEHKHFTM